MDKERFDKGLAKRKEVLGAEYVEAALARADDFNREFQEVVTEYCWGLGWGDETLDRKTRSIINLSMIAALNRMHEWELQFLADTSGDDVGSATGRRGTVRQIFDHESATYSRSAQQGALAGRKLHRQCTRNRQDGLRARYLPPRQGS